MATKNTIFTGAAYKLKQRKVLTTSTDPLRYAFDDNYNQTLAFMLEQGSWNFAQRSIEIDSDENVSPVFGFSNAFPVPDDFVRLIGISGVSSMWPPMGANDFVYEKASVSGAAYWSANLTLLYVSYVSNATTYGANLATWPETFATAFEYELAFRCAGQVTNMGTEEWEIFQKNRDKAMREARSKDAQNQALQKMPPGSLQRARMGSRGTWLWRG